MKAGLLMVGNELVDGTVRDVNASFIARELEPAGWEVSSILLVGDDAAAVKAGIEYLTVLSDALIVAGGLGPTVDDITAAAVAETFGLPLERNEKVLERLKGRFAAFRIPWTENNAKQACFPRGAEVIDNPAGTAAGFYLRRGKKIIVVVPGVPREVRKMVPEGVLPVLEKEFPGKRTRKTRKTLKVFGLSEARVDEMISRAGPFPHLSIGFYPHFPETHLVLIAEGADEKEAASRMERGEQVIREVLRPFIFGADDETLESVAARLLTTKGLTLAVAESFTGGLITDRLTDVPGSSLFLDRGIVSYSNEAKVDLLGVPREVIMRKGAVSRETAELMARGARERSRTDLGISTTGIAGPSGGSEEKPVGTVYLCLADAERVLCRKANFRWGRRGIKEMSAALVLDMIRRYLTGEKVCDE